jgi:uncharacterized protein
MHSAMIVEENEIVARVERIVRRRMADQQAGHGVDHVMRVLKTARQIQSEVGGERLVIELAALLHDLGDAKFHHGVERSGEFAREILSTEGLDADKLGAETIEHVASIVDGISFRKQTDPQSLTLEGKVVQDADRLDAIGAIGIVRTIEYGAVMGQPFHVADNPDGSVKTGVGHFHEKLFKLRGLLNTEPAKRIAVQREQFMQTFLDQFFEECG